MSWFHKGVRFFNPIFQKNPEYRIRPYSGFVNLTFQNTYKVEKDVFNPTFHLPRKQWHQDPKHNQVHNHFPFPHLPFCGLHTKNETFTMALTATIKVSRSHLIRMRIASADGFKSACRRFATPFYALIYEMVEVRANVFWKSQAQGYAFFFREDVIATTTP